MPKLIYCQPTINIQMKLSTIIISGIVLAGCVTSVALLKSHDQHEPEAAIEAPAPVEEIAMVKKPMPATMPPSASVSIKESQPIKVESHPKKKITKATGKVPDKDQITDDIMSQLEPANMVFTVDPKRSNISEQISVTMLIDFTKSIDELKKLTKQAEITSSARIEVSKVVVARVIAPDFNVIAITPEEQPVSHTSVTQWQWELIPLKTGKHEIHVSVNAEVNVDGNSKVRNIETFSETIVIEITPWQVVRGWLSQYWQWLFTTLILPLGLWVWKKFKNRAETVPV